MASSPRCSRSGIYDGIGTFDKANLVTKPGAGVSDFKALLIELIATLLFLMVISAVATDKNAPWNGIQAPIFIGLFIFTAATVFGPLSGGSFNPAVSLAPAITAGEFSNVWIYLSAPRSAVPSAEPRSSGSASPPDVRRTCGV